MPDTELSTMPLVEVKFTTTRPNTSTDFWWESTNPAVVALQNEIKRIAEEKNIPFEFSRVNDLVAVQRYMFFNTAGWREDFLPALRAAMPTFETARNQYYTGAGHSLAFTMRNTQTNNIISDMTIV